jgi:hypothetical protein
MIGLVIVCEKEAWDSYFMRNDNIIKDNNQSNEEEKILKYKILSNKKKL